MVFTEDYKIADKLGLTELNRWEDGIEHHPMSDRLVRFMADHDFNDYNDSMYIKVGGDGDNGEQLMYLMDTFFEMMDIKYKKLIEDNDIKHLEWIYKRMRDGYNENENYDYMIKFREIINKLKQI